MPINQHKITLKDDWKGSGYLKSVAEFLNQVARLINGMHFIRGGDIEIDRNYIRLRIKTPEPRQQSFGYKRNTNGTVTIESGVVVQGTESAESADNVVVTINSTNKAAPDFAYWRYPLGNLAALEIPSNPLSSRPVPNDTYFQLPIASFFKTPEGVVYLVKDHRFDYISTAFGA